MLPKDKYTIFDRKEKKYRKAIHSEDSRLCIRETKERERMDMLTLPLCRVAEVDETLPASQPSWILDGSRSERGGMYYIESMCIGSSMAGVDGLIDV